MNWTAKKISETRKIKGLTQDELAEQAKVHLRTIQRIENSDGEPRSKTLHLICEALEMDYKELIGEEPSFPPKNIGMRIINLIFLLALNLVLMSIIGFLTLDSNANMNSISAGFLISFLVPFLICYLTASTGGLERILKFGFGYIIYFVLVFTKHGFATGFVTGLFPCLLISLATLYFYNSFSKQERA